jgi:hypothetical protein
MPDFYDEQPPNASNNSICVLCGKNPALILTSGTVCHVCLDRLRHRSRIVRLRAAFLRNRRFPTNLDESDSVADKNGDTD